MSTPCAWNDSNHPYAQRLTIVTMVEKGLRILPLGGVGNLLFSIAAGLEQANRLGTQLSLIEDDGFGTAGEVLNWLSEPRIQSVPVSRFSIRKQKLLAKMRINRRIWFQESGFAYDSEIWKVEQNAFLLGYFQSPKYFPVTESKILWRILDSGTKAPASQAARVAIHVRRGDYLSKKALAKHGVTTEGYFLRSLDIIQSKFSIDEVEVFTDSVELLPDALKIFPQSPLNGIPTTKAAIASLNRMSLADTIITSNSTFSWWAARAARKRFPGVKIIAPYPWFSDGTTDGDLIPHDWERVPI